MTSTASATAPTDGLCRRFVQQMACLCKPGGTVILCDVMRKAGPMTPQLSKRFRDMDAIFETASPWASSEDYRRMMGEWAGVGREGKREGGRGAG